MERAGTGSVDLVAIDLNAVEAARAVRTAWDAGEAVFLIDPQLPDAAKTSLLWRVRPTAIIDGAGRRSVQGIPAEVDTAAVVLTSGTDANPKAVALTRSGMRAMATAYSSMLAVDDNDRWLAALPLTGVAGLAILARSYATGVPAVIHDRYTTSAVAHAAETREASIVSLVPTALARLLDAGAPLDRFRRIVVGGAPLPDRLAERAAAAGVQPVRSYGLTETWGGFALDGLPIDGAQVRVLQDGEIEVAGPMVMAGYRLDREATGDALRDGWLATGDLGSWDGTTLVVHGRKGDRIITGGVNVSPAAVERVLLSDPGIADAAVIGAPDEEWGERVVAYIVPVNPTEVPTLEHLRQLVKTHLSAANAPREVHPMTRIPRNNAGKLVRRELR